MANLGCELENIINEGIKLLPQTTSYTEEEIRSKYEDHSLNGVDHMVVHKDRVIFIQTKWKKTTRQQEVSQFIDCMNRIQSRDSSLPTKRVAMWVCQKSPTRYALSSLKDINCKIVSCNVSIGMLAKNTILTLCELFEIPSHISSVIIGSMPSPPSTTELENVRETHVVEHKVSFDETDEGKRFKETIERLIQQVCNFRYHLTNGSGGKSDIFNAIESVIPYEISRWKRSGTIRYHSIVKSLKKMCTPSKKNPCEIQDYVAYIAICGGSVAIARMAEQYTQLRDGAIEKGSAYAKELVKYKCTPCPINEAEFKERAKYCSNYDLYNGTMLGGGLDGLYRNAYRTFLI